MGLDSEQEISGWQREALALAVGVSEDAGDMSAPGAGHVSRT